MNINYDDYPSLLFLSYDKDTAPEGLPFEVASYEVRDFLASSKGYHNLYGYIAAKNSIHKRNTTTNYLLDNTTFHKIDADNSFRNNEFKRLFNNYIKPRHGVILCPHGGQYVYLFMSKAETKNVLNQEGRYFAAALYKQNFFIGFEEGIILDKGIKVLETGNYSAGMDVGGYLSFCIITLAFTNNRELPVYHSDTTAETIFTV